MAKNRILLLIKKDKEKIENDEKKLPTTQYLTELQPLQTTAWYYYVADYEEWRNHRQTTCDAR
jgi:hypothetical protein